MYAGMVVKPAAPLETFFLKPTVLLVCFVLFEFYEKLQQVMLFNIYAYDNFSFSCSESRTKRKGLTSKVKHHSQTSKSNLGLTKSNICLTGQTSSGGTEFLIKVVFPTVHLA